MGLQPGDLVRLNDIYNFPHRVEGPGDICFLVQHWEAADVWRVIHGRTGLQFDVHDLYLDKLEGT